jgi:hypothetical protein
MEIKHSSIRDQNEIARGEFQAEDAAFRLHGSTSLFSI